MKHYESFMLRRKDVILIWNPAWHPFKTEYWNSFWYRHDKLLKNGSDLKTPDPLLKPLINYQELLIEQFWALTSSVFSARLFLAGSI